MHPVKKWGLEKLAKHMVDVLNQKSYEAYYAENAEQAKQMILDMIPKGSSVAMGGSVTLMDMGFIDIFRNGDYKFFDRYQPMSYAECYQVYRKSMLADYLVTGINAITEDGQLVATDSSGNRTGGIIFGPENVIIVAGANKIVKNLDEAFARIKRVAPLNAKRIGHRTPCAETGICQDCQTPERICNATCIIHHGMKHKGRYKVILIGDELGF